MGNKKRKAPSPAESHRPAPSRPASPVLQAENHCDTPDQGYFDFDYTQQFADDDSSSELEYHQEEPPPPRLHDILQDMLSALSKILEVNKPTGRLPASLPLFVSAILNFWATAKPELLEPQLKTYPAICKLINKEVSEALAKATPPPPPPPTMEVDSPTTPTGPKPTGATPPT
ncbi:hypothetical protein H0H81_011484 [Sphagnurus paluster]|uniref:Uncharacterized protein n=1 Tax=Sphagnurus paluster TaxID=117069 RepID=A0A9P7FQD7_9AGAR|nr:hypothetical protein H0H81_011484 [Sphagnurus paluster]